MTETSLAAHRSVTAEMREAIHVKIVSALEIIGEGSFQDIAAAAKLDEGKVWRRIGECLAEQKIITTGDKKKLKSGRMGRVYSLPPKPGQMELFPNKLTA